MSGPLRGQEVAGAPPEGVIRATRFRCAAPPATRHCIPVFASDDPCDVSTHRLPPGSLYRSIFEEAQRRRKQGLQRLAEQIKRIEDKQHGERAQEQRKDPDH